MRTGSKARQQNVLALVSTAKFLLLVDLNTRTVTPIENDRTEYYGISWFPGGEDLVLSHSAVDNGALVDPISYLSSECGFLSVAQWSTPTFLSQPHQILCGSDGRVICTNTGRNSICSLRLDQATHMQEVKVSAPRWDRMSLSETSGDHLNSLFERDGRLYVLAHGHEKGSALATFSFPELELLSVDPIAGRVGMHNIWVTAEGQHIGCDSEAGALLDIKANQYLWKSGEPIYTRGLAASDDFVLIGESQKLARDLRSASMAGLWIVDRRTWRTLDYVCLGPYGAVNEVRLINTSDDAHHGHVFEGWVALKKKDIRGRITKKKLEVSRSIEKFNIKWSEFELVFGAPILNDKGGRVAPNEILCLQTRPSSQNDPRAQLQFRYALDGPAGPSHVSVISGQGDRADTNMHAITIQRLDETRALMNFWANDGVAWRLQPLDEVEDIPLAAEVVFRKTTDGGDLFVNSVKILSLSSKTFPTAGRQLGVRWIGATIYPSKSAL